MMGSRRRFLTTVGAVSTVGLAGCAGLTTSEEEKQLEQQKAAFERFVTAVNQNDLQTVKETVAGWAAGGFTADNIGAYSLDYEELTKKEGPKPTQSGYKWFNTALTITHEGQTRTADTDIGLLEVQDGGTWMVTSIQVNEGRAFIVGGTVLGTPTVFFEGAYDPEATSSGDTGVLTLTQTGGATFPTGETLVAGSITNPRDATPDITTSGVSLKEATGSDTFSPGESVTVGVKSDYAVRIGYQKAGDSDVAWIGDVRRS